MNEDYESEEFSYTQNLDIHCLDLYCPLQHAVAIASEHNFRGIVTQLGRLDELVKIMSKDVTDRNIMPIAAIDYPYGTSSTDVRHYSITAAKEKGAKEVEVVAPYHHIVNHDFNKITEDIRNLIAASSKAKIGLKYILDLNCEFIDDSIKTKLYRILNSVKIPIISTSTGYFDNNLDHSENIIKMRNLKSKTNTKIKVYLDSIDSSQFALYPRAGVDILGLNWDIAANVAHGYEQIMQEKKNA